MTIISELLDAIEGKADLWDAKDEWNRLRRHAAFYELQKTWLGRAIEIRQSRSDMDYMYGLCLAAYIMSWDDLLERYQEKDILDDWYELCMSFSEEEKKTWPI